MKIRRVFEPGMHLLYQGERGGRAFIIDKGWSFSSCTQANGSRQILDVQVPGDVAGLPSLSLPFATHDVTAITRIEAFELGVGLISEATADDPELSAFLLWLSASDGVVAAERLTSLGRRSALARTAHFILELAARLRLAGMGTELGFACPMTQYIFADALGLTPVHVNRIFRELRLGGLASHARGWLNLIDAKKLADTAMFESDYLEHTSLLGR